VAVVTIRPQRVELTTELPGRAHAYRTAEIRPRVSGIVEKRHFEEGSDVRAGDLLYSIERAPFQVAYDSAKASLAKAEASLASIKARAGRYKDLIKDNAISQQEYDDAAAALEQNLAEIEYWKARVEAARIDLDYTNITAPISGRTGKSHITEGALVTAHQAQALTTIQQLDPMYVDVTQSSTDYLRLRRRLEDGILHANGSKSSPVQIIMADSRPHPMHGELKFRDVRVDPSTGSTTLRIVVSNPENTLLPGMFVHAVITDGIVKNAILVPQQGVSRNQKGQAVALVVNDQGVVEQRVLDIDRAMGTSWLINSGLAPDDRVIVEGQLRVRPGAKVAAVPFAPENTEPSN
jgi:membrane fusion protein (multidrug efflux system)